MLKRMVMITMRDVVNILGVNIDNITAAAALNSLLKARELR